MKIAMVGFVAMSIVTVLTMLVLSASPSLVAVFYRTAGIIAGAATVMWREGKDPRRWRDRLARLVPVMILPYLVSVLFVSDLLTPHWRTMPEALAALDEFGLLPFYHHYIVSKAHAVESVAVHVLIFAPIGVMIALRRGSGRIAVWTAAIIAALFSLAIEFGRWLKPDLQPDFSNAIIAGVAAGFAGRFTDVFWRMLEGALVVGTAALVTEHPSARSFAPERHTEAGSRDNEQSRPRTTWVGLAMAAVCFPLAAAITANYPLGAWLLGVLLALYGLALWRWPSLWLAVIPALLPTLDFTPWTGWMYVGEPDLFVLVTIGILALRSPPRRVDFAVGGLPAVALAVAFLACLAGIVLGLSLPGPAGGSDNPYLRPDNALRLAKGFFVALALLPFLRERMRGTANAMAWLGAGMSAGLALVAAAAIVERALFTSLFDFTSGYRVVGTFSSMHIGGGHIGAYIAMALPFLLVFLLRPRPAALLAMLGIALCSGYALVVSYARAAYAAGLISTLTACAGWAWTARRTDRRGAEWIFPVLLLLPLGCGVIAAATVDAGFMSERLHRVSPDLARREHNWTQGLALRDNSPIGALFGSGLGTYPRIVLADKPQDLFPTNFVVEHDGAYPFLSLQAGVPIYIGQKISIEPDQQYRLFVTLRSPKDGGVLMILLCEKLLLYSDNCRGLTFKPRGASNWEDFGAAISTAGLDEDVALGWLRRPVELALVVPNPGTTIDVGHIRMFDPQGHDILANGDFSRGTERWYFTDDQHLIWRIHSQYLMSWFEGGVLGLAAFLSLAGTALVGAARAMGCGDRMAAAVAGSLVAFLISGLFDYLLEAPRLSALFYLVAFTGLTMLKPASSSTAR